MKETIEVSSLLNSHQYDATTGLVMRIFKTKTKILSCKSDEGYVVTRIKGKHILVHRLAWALYHGEWPDGIVDHINGIKEDNRIENLRICSIRINKINTTCNRNGNKFGCFYSKRQNKWVSRIRIGNSRKHIGSFDTRIEAHNAYLKQLEILETAWKITR